MSYPWITPLIAALLSLGLAVLVNRTGPKTPLSQVFTFLACMLVFWNLNFFVLYSVTDRDLALELTRYFRLGSFFLLPAILHLSVVLYGRPSRIWRAVLVVDYAVTCLLVTVNAFGLFLSDLRQFVFGYYSVGTAWYDLFTASLVFNVTAAFGLLIYVFRSTTDARVRLQLKFWLFGMAVALPVGLTHLLPAYGVPFYPLGNISCAAWAGIVAYAIVRHRLMDIDVVLTKGAAYAIVSIVLVAPAFAFALWLQRESFGQIHYDFSVAILLMLLAVGVLFPTLRLRAESRIARSLFAEKHAYRAALVAFSRDIIRILDRDRLISELCQTLHATLKLDRIAMALTRGDKTAVAVVHSLGIPPATEEFSAESPFVRVLSRCREAVLRDELLELPGWSHAEHLAVASVCDENGWEVCIPLHVGPELTGFLALGRKRSFDTFFAEDLELLGTLAAEASVALENARLYDALRRSQDIIRRADRLSALGTLAAGIAHEIRNPLVSIQTFFQLAPQRLDDQEFLTEFLNLTSGEVKRITDLISELLSFARSPTPSISEIDLNGLVESVSRLIEPQLRTGQIEVVRDLWADLPLVRGDRDQLKQVFLNIILNAVQAMDGGGRIRIASRELTIEGERLCQIEIADTGRGIAAENLDSIFNPFFTTKDKGTGLGLAISNQVVTEHGGFIAVESQVGEGTTFRVHLAVAQLAKDAEPELTGRRVAGVNPRHR